MSNEPPSQSTDPPSENTSHPPPDPPAPAVDVQYEHYESKATDLDNLFEVARLSDFCTSIEFINALRKASLDREHSNLSPSAIQRIRNPASKAFNFNDDPDLRLGLDIIMSNISSSNHAYHSTVEAIKR